MNDSRKRRQNSGLRSRAGSGEIPQSRERNSHGHSHGRSKMPANHGHGKSNFQRQTSYDRVRKIVQEEGREARNLVQWNVPVEEEAQRGQLTRMRQPQKAHAKSPSRGHARSSSTGKVKIHGEVSRDRDPTPPTKRSLLERPSSRSSGGSHTPRKGDLRARYWAFLFENLRRAVDEIYQTCETDESVVECKEVIMMLEQCTKDFKSLIERLNLLKAYESAEEGQKPTSLAWEVRKSSPGKVLAAGTAKDHLMPTSAVSRNLNFGSALVPPKPGNSWADKVKGTASHLPTQPRPTTITDSPGSEYMSCDLPPADDITAAGTLIQEHDFAIPLDPVIDDDAEGWETVHRNRTKKSNSGGSNSNRSSLHGSDHDLYRQRSRTSSKTSDKDQQVKGNTKGQGQTQTFRGSREKVSSPSLRNRVDSRESEKENRPVNAYTGNVYQNQEEDKKVPRSLTPVKQAWNLPDKEQKIESLNMDNTSSQKTLDRYEAEVEKLNDQLRDLKTEEEYSVELSMENVAEQFSADVALDKVTDQFSSDDEKEDEDEEVEELATRLDDALECAIKEEDKLSHQLEQEQEDALETAIQEEQTYLKEIEQEEKREIILDEETETESELGNTMNSGSLQRSWDWEQMVKEYDEAAQSGSTMSWGDMVEESDTRTPGRVVHMHEKLSSPSRKRSPTESRKRHEEKQAKAQELREKMLQDKAERLRMLTSKVEEVRVLKEEIMQQRRVTIESKMQRAEEKRRVQLLQKARKAHEEETKASEIAFINSLEMQNKRHDIITKHQESEARLHEIQEERQRRVEEKAAKEAAVEERRKALEAERQQRLHEIQERRRQRETEFEQRQQEREKERVEAARLKERERGERIAALNAQQQAHIEVLQKKIQQKQDDSARRHKENLDQIREKAFEMTVLKHSTEDHNDVPELAPYDRKKYCTFCSVMIPSEVYLQSHLRGKNHRQAMLDNNGGKELTKEDIEQFNLKHISDAPTDKPDPRIAVDKERQKTLKKRCKKLRQRMSQRGTEYENSLITKQQTVDSEHRAKLQKIVKDLNKFIQTPDKGPWPQNKVSALERALGEISRIMEKRNLSDQNALRILGGHSVLSSILQVISQSKKDLPPVLPTKSLVHTSTVLRLAVKGCYDNAHFMLFSNRVGNLVDLLCHQLQVLMPDNVGVSQNASGSSSSGMSVALLFDPVASSLMQLIASILNCLAKHNPSSKSSEASAERMSSSGDAFMTRASDIISYIVSTGVVDKLTQYFSSVRGPLDEDQSGAEFLQHSMGLLTAITKLISTKNTNVFDGKKGEDLTQLVATFKVTDLVGIVSLVYGMLLHSNTPGRSETASSPPELPQHTITSTTIAIKMLNHMAMLDLNMLQTTLGEEGMSLEFRHIASYLLWYCSYWPNEELLHEVILCVGYFTVLHHDNQVIIQSGQPPTVLQQLCSLPFQYFSSPKLTNVLFPTLISCCYHSQSNRKILEQELSCDLLANFIEEKHLEGQQAKLSPTTVKKSKATDKESDRMLLNQRFPLKEWNTAQEYFKN